MTKIQLVDDPEAAYRPGACNIGAAEIRRRRKVGVAMLVVTVVLAVALVAVGAPTWARLLVFFPAAGAAIGLLQARFRFCVAFALAGVRNFGALGAEAKVADAAAHRADLAAAARLIGISAMVGAVVAVGLALLPV
ncbi:MAG: hypothetical protein WCH74_10265 [Chloroflexota bacterium]